jgi:hypothetical protein
MRVGADDPVRPLGQAAVPAPTQASSSAEGPTEDPSPASAIWHGQMAVSPERGVWPPFPDREGGGGLGSPGAGAVACPYTGVAVRFPLLEAPG